MALPIRRTSGLAAALALITVLAGPAAAPAAPSATEEAALIAARAARMKEVERALLMQGARRRIEAARERERQRRSAPRGAAGIGFRARAPRFTEPGGPQGTPATRAPQPAGARRAAAGAALAPNVRVSLSTYGQAEESIAALGPDVLVTWNDGAGFAGGGNGDTQGYGWSADSGATYQDGGAPPTPAGWRWASDPVTGVNERTGDFWYCALVDVGTGQNGVAVARARFQGGVPVWSTPTLVRVGPNSIMFDKPWLAVDSLSGRVYLTYTVFDANGDTIVFQRSGTANPLTQWDPPQRMSPASQSGFVQGSRPVAGVDGQVYVVWYAIGPIAKDAMMIRKSNDFGAAFGLPAVVDSLYSNYGSGAPGFNRGMGITYPSIAVDRSHSAHRGRVYVTWNESLNYFDDALGRLDEVVEEEPNDAPATANSFTVGQVVRGLAWNDFDYFQFTGNAGQTVIFFADSIPAQLELSLRIFCTDGATRLSYSAPGKGLNNVCVFTLPAAGTYYMRAVSNVPVDSLSTPKSSLGYRIVTGFDTPSPLTAERALDHRDVFVTWSDDGAAWATPVRASDSPKGYDDWLPEVAVAGDSPDPRIGSGRPFCFWYDWRDSPEVCGGASNVYLARSDDFGGSWATAGVVSDQRTFWTNVTSNIVPNQGDYLSLFANENSVFASWADGRSGDPDVYAARIPLAVGQALIVLTDVRVTPTQVTLTWYAGGRTDFTATVERRDSTAHEIADLGPVSAGADGFVRFTDTNVEVGHLYGYWLAWTDSTGAHTTPVAWVEIPRVAAGLTLNVDLDRARTGEGVWVAFSIPDDGTGTLALFDVMGRRIAERRVGPGENAAQLAPGSVLESGIYFVQLTHGSRKLSARAVVLR